MAAWAPRKPLARMGISSRSVGIRMAVIAAGPAMNFLFAFAALIFLFSVYGIDSFDSTRVNPQENSLAAEVGLVRGDRVRTVGGTPSAMPTSWPVLWTRSQAAVLGSKLSATVFSWISTCRPRETRATACS